MTKRQIKAHKGDESGSRSEWVVARATLNEKARIERVARKYGLSIADYIHLKTLEDDMDEAT